MKRLAITISMFLCAILVGFAQVDLQPLATVKITKTEPITLKQLKSRVESYKLQTGRSTFSVEEKKAILDGMINEKLIVQAAQKEGITLTDKQVNDYFLATMAQQIGQQITEAQLAAIVQEQAGMSLDDYIRTQVGMNLSEYKNYIKNQLIAQEYIKKLKQEEIMKASAPSDADVRSFYELKKSDFFQSDILKLFLVMVPKGNDEKAALNKAKSLLEDVKANKTTPDKLKLLAQTDTSFQAGDLFVSKTEQAAMQLGINYQGLIELFTKDKDYISDLTTTAVDFQFYIIRDKHDAKLLGLSDVIQPESTTTVYEYIRDNLALQNQSNLVTAAVNEITESLRTSSNFQMMKSGESLNTLLADW